MTSSEIANINNRVALSHPETITSSTSSKNLYPFKVIQYFLLTSCVGSSIVFLGFRDSQQAVIIGIVALTIAIFLYLINKEVLQASQQAAKQSDISKKAELYSYLLANNSELYKTTITPAREKALQYCQDLIDDYKRTRNLARNLYYILQISTVILSGVTPILVLVDKLETGQPWLKWLPVICPAIASIVASIVTSFPFQKNSVAANTAVELLEAEQEKFILGITPLYRSNNLSSETEQLQTANQIIENFVVQVNNIHLQQVQQTSEQSSEKKDTSPANEQNKEATNEEK
ncbi:hypothetical protein NIES2100_74810 [Calothrix sp. NIES-2100]|uniref:DUF4231 domain-containing protein n=1 Tax=Calothrix sp. NIES-2100 TaxID=1954172 RepID=UPI000B60D11B|nr:hypothetical protein NIES2100_74810 [Calothrix sp. NIES-2100]